MSDSAATTAAKPIGNCVRCGGSIYEYLVHHCTTSVRKLNYAEQRQFLRRLDAGEGQVAE